MKTYEIIKYLTDEEIERGLATEYTPRNRFNMSLPRNCDGRCFLGEAVPLFDKWSPHEQIPSPTPHFFGTQLAERGPMFEIERAADEFVDDFDRGLITDLAATIAASRALHSS